MIVILIEYGVFFLGVGLFGGMFMGIMVLGLVEVWWMIMDYGSVVVWWMFVVFIVSFGVGQMVGFWLVGQLYVLIGLFQVFFLVVVGVLIVVVVFVV